MYSFLISPKETKKIEDFSVKVKDYVFDIYYGCFYDSSLNFVLYLSQDGKKFPFFIEGVFFNNSSDLVIEADTYSEIAGYVISGINSIDEDILKNSGQIMYIDGAFASHDTKDLNTENLHDFYTEVLKKLFTEDFLNKLIYNLKLENINFDCKEYKVCTYIPEIIESLNLPVYEDDEGDRFGFGNINGRGRYE